MTRVKWNLKARVGRSLRLMDTGSSIIGVVRLIAKLPQFQSLSPHDAANSRAKDYKLSASWEATQVLNFFFLFDVLPNFRLFGSFVLFSLRVRRKKGSLIYLDYQLVWRAGAYVLEGKKRSTKGSTSETLPEIHF